MCRFAAVEVALRRDSAFGDEIQELGLTIECAKLSIPVLFSSVLLEVPILISLEDSAVSFLLERLPVGLWGLRRRRSQGGVFVEGGVREKGCVASALSLPAVRTIKGEELREPTLEHTVHTVDPDLACVCYLQGLRSVCLLL